jgi:CheY-like chemotaxis protein
MVEIATVGDEGLIGISVLFGGGIWSGDTMMQVPDTSAEVLSVDVFSAELARHGPFFDCVQRYAQGLLTLMMQSTGCLALHSVQERCCRWLLMAHDRVHQDEFHFSHEFQPATATHAEEAFTRASACHPDVIVVDANLAGVLTHQLIRWLREDPRTMGARIIVMTSDASACLRPLTAGDECDLCIQKPCTPDVLGLAVRDLIAKGAPRFRTAVRRAV